MKYITGSAEGDGLGVGVGLGLGLTVGSSIGGPSEMEPEEPEVKFLHHLSMLVVVKPPPTTEPPLTLLIENPRPLSQLGAVTPCG